MTFEVKDENFAAHFIDVGLTSFASFGNFDRPACFDWKKAGYGNSLADAVASPIQTDLSR